MSWHVAYLIQCSCAMYDVPATLLNLHSTLPRRHFAAGAGPTGHAASSANNIEVAAETIRSHRLVINLGLLLLNGSH